VRHLARTAARRVRLGFVPDSPLPRLPLSVGDHAPGRKSSKPSCYGDHRSLTCPKSRPTHRQSQLHVSTESTISRPTARSAQHDRLCSQQTRRTRPDATETSRRTAQNRSLLLISAHCRPAVRRSITPRRVCPHPATAPVLPEPHRFRAKSRGSAKNARSALRVSFPLFVYMSREGRRYNFSTSAGPPPIACARWLGHQPGYRIPFASS
jgi:hypothetical protein